MGRTALHDAAWWGNGDAVDALLAGGALKTATDNQGRTPHDLAVIRGTPEIAAKLSS